MGQYKAGLSLWQFSKSLRLKSSLFLVVLLSGALTLLGGLTLQAVKGYQMDQMASDLASRAKTVNLNLKQALLAKGAGESSTDLLKRKSGDLLRAVSNERALASFIYVKGSEQKGLGDKPDQGVQPLQSFLEPELEAEVLAGKILYQVHDKGAGAGDLVQSPMFVDYLAPLYDGDEIIGVVRLQYYYQHYIEFYENMKRMVLVTGVGVFCFSLVAALVYFGRMTSAVHRLERSVHGVAQGAYDKVEVLNRQDELGDLSLGVSQMARQIEETLTKLQQEHEHLSLAVGKLKAMESDQRKFFGSITHEFKTPLSVINAYNDLTDLYGDDEALQAKTRQQIRDEVHKLAAMVEKALDLAKLEKYDFELQIDSVAMETLVAEAVDRLRVKGDKYGIQWHVALEPVVLAGDREMLGQIVVNLLDNAIKYNVADGSIWVTLAVVPGTRTVELTIENTGEGLTDLVKDRLFEAFAADDTLSQTSETATGLGLALVKRLVTLQKGRILIEEGLPDRQLGAGKGCRVVIELTSTGDNLETTSL